MKCYIINMKTEPHKRHRITEQCEQYGISYEVINAVAGNELSFEVLSTVTHDYPTCNLTPGEIGCALSHLHIYSKMASENTPFALILEDDAVLNEKVINAIDSISKSIESSSPEIFLLNSPESYYPKFKRSISGTFSFYKMARASQACAYIINKEAANKILNFNLPIKFEADRWMFFRDFCSIKIWCLNEGLVDSNDADKAGSSLESGRKKLKDIRESYMNKLQKKQKGYQLKRMLNLMLKKISYKSV
ncbi:glycosyltransferase family 25 protein [Enterobacter cloacae complex sp. 2022EL-00788]|uniref:glycosyltransferase family 25 protein n=1 Tax=Enterobacter cloacae complex sp. 2022EL-00788 TaxID=2996512 RepID=UPI00226FB9AB|nr:glycosyltransferase family 25 protein [Enterobacter cloacae complex sp. 2022EL-00788]MCY0772621.1 glycosyltransferase family 25 protein [Enterobacter cloacae complex sp. 2022EL-00788]